MPVFLFYCQGPHLQLLSRSACWGLRDSSDGLWAALRVTLNCRSLVSPKWKKHRRGKPNNYWDKWKVSACTMASVCVHVNRCTTAALNIFSLLLQKVPNFRPCVSCSISLRYVRSCPFALLIILISLITQYLSFGNCPTPQKACAGMRLISTVLNKVLRCTDKHAPHNWCQGMYCCILNLFRDADSKMTCSL